MLVIEARTSVILADVLRQDTELDRDATALRDCLNLGLTRWRTEPKDRRYVAITAFRSEELGSRLDGVAKAIGVLLSADLSASPKVILLDRANAGRLLTERELTAMELAIKSSMICLEGAVRLLSDRQTCRISIAFNTSLRLRSTVTVETPLAKVTEARRSLAEAVLDNLGVVAPGTPALAPDREADLIALQSGIEAAEAAYLLDPTQARLARVVCDTQGIRSWELHREFWRNEVVLRRRQGKKPIIPDIFRLSAAEPLTAEPLDDGSGIRGVAAGDRTYGPLNWWNRVPYRNAKPSPEYIALEKDILRYWLACDACDGGDGGMILENTLRCMRGWSANAGEWSTYLRQALAYHIDRSHQLGRRYCNPSFLRHMAVWQQDPNPFVKVETFGAIEPTILWMCQQDDPLLARLSLFML
jgi:hypothetical protein